MKPHPLSNYRPISLCYATHKINYKILSRRLKTVLHKFISPLQDVFVLVRIIKENSIIAHKIFHKICQKQEKCESMAIKVDMEKVFDRME